MEKSFFLSGIGGQGIQLLGKNLLYAVNEVGMNGSYFPTYTGTRRGGYSFCRVICTEGRVGSPELPKYDVAALMDNDSYVTFKDIVKPEGILIVNTDLIEEVESDKEIRVVKLPMMQCAQEMGNMFTFNLILGGVIVELTHIVPNEILKEQMLKKLARNEEMKKLYERAFEKGVELAKAV
ncbi:2-oxoacid:acceptor oxidoreductase family protein [Faecalicatena acetigenes]|uniref:2-oxoacid:acceptor oxidoreductase family protein n=1 Tax=Faecalicatena acetigenes TaxID=2981790 RepID=A0ABT2T804_9FIRM|nr:MULTISPECIES: 2-oxoacid:acceptor oxidoreductase family protein [Lachnospiraceae]MCU6746400.1 2-oxoacid:acceptor oxidoreductase family protein [Faecalicatena acetigenes]SCH16356.1 2-oxoglutarate ferredoxin oxidoreductase subunit gamma [uncultured Clostridium sp.]